MLYCAYAILCYLQWISIFTLHLGIYSPKNYLSPSFKFICCSLRSLFSYKKQSWQAVRIYWSNWLNWEPGAEFNECSLTIYNTVSLIPTQAIIINFPSSSSLLSSSGTRTSWSRHSLVQFRRQKSTKRGTNTRRPCQRWSKSRWECLIFIVTL